MLNKQYPLSRFIVHNVFKGRNRKLNLEPIMQPKKSLLPLLTLLLITNTLTTPNAKAQTENFTVPPETETTRTLNLRKDDRVAIGFTIVGKSANEINFYITDPNGNTIKQYDTVGQKSFSLTATTSGAYILHFDNIHSPEEKMVTLNYDIQHYILGLPQTLFYVLVIAVISVIGIAFFVLLAKPRY